ncbi:hypothetical protein CCR75_002213 [Bremia lactucae]|uniref:Uncharacterized protein n=1 Tax=Bremia lactucae TaxID=4779 RepID=A0A976FPP7_BRELC|nr:hypothetical protein CCR75_002213 [Bremia lactucae]
MRLALFSTVFFGTLLASTKASQERFPCRPACAKGETCKLQKVLCVTTPCYPIATCVPNETIKPACTKICSKNELCQIDSATSAQYCLNPCAFTLCGANTTCEIEQVQCIRAPCPSTVVCKPIETDPSLC